MAAMKRLIVVGDRVLVKPGEGEDRTKVGLYLPATAIDNQAVQTGMVVAVGPGKREGPDLIPMGVRVGDKVTVRDNAQAYVCYHMGKKVLAVYDYDILAICEQVTADEEPSRLVVN